MVIYLILLGWCLVAFVAGRLLPTGHQALRLFEGEALAVVFLGFFAVPYQHLAGLPTLLDIRVSQQHRFLAPFVVGIAFALADLLALHFIRLPATGQLLPSFLQPFPYSFLYFVADAIYLEVIYRLLPFTILLSLLGHRQLTAGRTPLAFWIVAALCAVAAPYQLIVKAPPALMVTMYVLHFVFNMIQALFYKNAGLLASLSMRLGNYLLWYILLGMWLQWHL
ncbi:hypothetical protein GA0116948_102339 [Chitinophaga costaii]|uniref:CAAX protease self-immunity n=1 Tax=Chitinophaga costaii TaxID=1335309 RepID=A0A1C4AYD5_9BACT|nr:hypothetical protein GA0116948_102339 [Chitinophaga costaii]